MEVVGSFAFVPLKIGSVTQQSAIKDSVGQPPPHVVASCLKLSSASTVRISMLMPLQPSRLWEDPQAAKPVGMS